MAKILLWNVPPEYKEAIIQAARLAPTLEVDEVSDNHQFAAKVNEARALGQPYTQIIVFSDFFVTPQFAALAMKADLILHEEPPSLPDFLVEFNRTFHPWKK